MAFKRGGRGRWNSALSAICYSTRVLKNLLRLVRAGGKLLKYNKASIGYISHYLNIRVLDAERMTKERSNDP